MVKISKNGIVRNQTERTMFALLHQDVEVFRHSHMFMRRNTANARAALERWAQSGVLETRQEKYSQYSSYTHTVYRLAPEWRDPDLTDANLVAEDAELTRQEAMNVNRLHESAAELGAAWTGLRDVVAQMAAIDDDDLDRVRDVLNEATRAVMRRSHAVGTRTTLAERRADMDARLATRGPVAAMAVAGEAAMVGATADSMSDPLGGDA